MPRHIVHELVKCGTPIILYSFKATSLLIVNPPAPKPPPETFILKYIVSFTMTSILDVFSSIKVAFLSVVRDTFVARTVDDNAKTMAKA